VKKLIPVLFVICATAFGAPGSDMDRLYDEAVANAKTPKEKTLALFEQRIHKLAKKKTGIEEIFIPKDGVDQFEAFVLAHAFFAQNFGGCGAVDLPEKKGDFWFVDMVVGSAAQQLPPAVIDSRTGKLTCEGHPSVTDALAYLKDFMRPNQQPQQQRP
jgi:hypothetical protein